MIFAPIDTERKSPIRIIEPKEKVVYWKKGTLKLFIDDELYAMKSFGRIEQRKEFIRNWYIQYPSLKNKYHYFQIIYKNPDDE